MANTGEKISCKTPGWVLTQLKGMGYAPDTTMDDLQETWRTWWACDNAFYENGYDLGSSVSAETRLSLRPAQMVAEEWPALIMTEGTHLSAEDEGLGEWIERAAPDFCEQQSDFIAIAFALGCGCWTVAATTGEGGASTAIESHPAWETVPLVGGGVAVTSRVTVEGRILDQIQVHAYEPETATWHIHTRLYTPKQHQPVAVDAIIEDLDTGQVLPTYAIVAPGIPNTYYAHSQAGVSCFAAAVDACRVVDEAYNQLYWQTRVSLPRVFLDDAALRRDPKTGEPLATSSVDQVIFRATHSADGAPITVYNPDTRIPDMVTALDCALATLGLKAGFGQQHWSFDGAQGLKTATEVVASNATLMRSVRRHENAIESAVVDVVMAAYATECALRGQRLEDVPRPTVTWDDSVATDTETQRATMKDDIARGLCPAWLYPATYYGMTEEEARALTESDPTGMDLGME